MRYLITISYDGSKYNGFQRQKEVNSVQREIEKALTTLNKKEVLIKGAGRTDRGVHALGQRAHFDLDIEIPAENLKKALNGLLSEYIYISDCKEVQKDFHARYNVIEKTYSYKINTGDYNPLLEDYNLQIDYKLDLKEMKKCAKEFIGVHNFKNFVAGYREKYEAIIYDISFEIVDSMLIINFKGKSFYRYMVRNLVGAILEVGKGKTTVDKVIELLENPDKESTFPTAKANGLYLVSIRYE